MLLLSNLLVNNFFFREQGKYFIVTWLWRLTYLSFLIANPDRRFPIQKNGDRPSPFSQKKAIAIKKSIG
jgi:hypothetical protein